MRNDGRDEMDVARDWLVEQDEIRDTKARETKVRQSQERRREIARPGRQGTPREPK